MNREKQFVDYAPAFLKQDDPYAQVPSSSNAYASTMDTKRVARHNRWEPKTMGSGIYDDLNDREEPAAGRPVLQSAQQ